MIVIAELLKLKHYYSSVKKVFDCSMLIYFILTESKLMTAWDRPLP